MAKDKSKSKKLKRVFTVNLYHDGVFVPSPLRYIQGDVKQITYIDFEGMSYEDLTEIVKRLVLGLVKRLYYCKTGCKLSLGIKELKSDSHVDEFLKLGYDNGFMVDLYVEHFDYDVMDYLNYETEEVDNQTSSDEYTSDDGNEEIDGTVFFTTGEEDVVIKPMDTHDEFLNRLCSNRGLFRGYVPDPPSTQPNIPEEDPDASRIDHMFKVKKGVVYPVFNPNIPWNQMEPVLGMRYEDPDQLKLALCNYAVAHGYQLWYMRNDWKAVLVFCGRNVDEGRSAGKKGNKNMVFNKDRKRKADRAESSKKGNVKNVRKKVGLKKKCNKVNDKGEGSSKVPVLTTTGSPGKKWTRQMVRKDKNSECPFRMRASWMSTENSFQIKSLNSEHKCSRNYNIGSIVNYRWIATQCARDIIKDPFISLRTLKEQIREKYMIEVSLGQCQRAKLLALYDHEGGLIEHYGKLWDYRQAILDSNPGSTCRLDVEETAAGKSYFKRFYICFKGVRDGWLAGCRKVIGLDGCFLKHTCRGNY